MPPSIERSTYQKTGTQFSEWNGWSQDNWATTYQLSKVMRFGKRGHHGWPTPDKFDVGGDFWLEGYERQDALVPLGRIYQSTNDYWRDGYSGNMWVTLPGVSAVPMQDASAWAATAYSKLKPTKPEFSGLNALYELREFPDMVHQFRERLQNFRDLGKHYLGANFGWKPFLSDLKNLVDLQQRAQKKLKQLIRDNGKPVRRRKILSDLQDDPVIEEGEPWGYWLPQSYLTATPHYRQTTVYRDRIWASARFRYWLPEGPKDVKWNRIMMGRLYGLDLTPSVIYNAIPWSWLVDWFSNVGDVVENLDAGVADRLAADYFYVMRHTSRDRARTTNAQYMRRSGEMVKLTGTAFSSSFCKTRLKGDPFGFNTKQEDLNGMQLAILGALGLSRIR